MDNVTKPFGLRFAEKPRRETEGEAFSPYYDYETGLSYVIDENGQKQPFVLWAWDFAGETRTGTTTKATGDSEDTDVDSIVKTQTITETREHTDVD